MYFFSTMKFDWDMIFWSLVEFRSRRIYIRIYMAKSSWLHFFLLFMSIIWESSPRSKILVQITRGFHMITLAANIPYCSTVTGEILFFFILKKKQKKAKIPNFFLNMKFYFFKIVLLWIHENRGQYNSFQYAWNFSIIKNGISLLNKKIFFSHF